MEKIEKNIYVIRRKLNELKKDKQDNRFRFYINKFTIVIAPTKLVDYICLCDNVNISLLEEKRDQFSKYDQFIDLEKDERFKDYQPIKYHELPGYSNGDKMPINYLCELVIYLYKLSKLSAFW